MTDELGKAASAPPLTHEQKLAKIAQTVLTWISTTPVDFSNVDLDHVAFTLVIVADGKFEINSTMPGSDTISLFQAVLDGWENQGEPAFKKTSLKTN